MSLRNRKKWGQFFAYALAFTVKGDNYVA
ncbi:membrane protein YoeI [Klebsiella pneumoniae]